MRGIVEVDRGSLRIDGIAFDRGQPLAWFVEVLRTDAVRTEVPEIARRAPHLSNKIHIFDALGIVLVEDHAHRLVFSITLAFVPADVAFPPARPFEGEVSAFGVRLKGRETEAEARAIGLEPDEAFLHRWSWEMPTCSAGLTFTRPRGPAKRRGAHGLSELNFGIFTPEHLAARSRHHDV